MITDEMVEAALPDQLMGRAQFLRDRGEIKTPELLERAARALTAANAAAWRPIDSAPRDGTEVIVTDGLGVYGDAWWHDGDQVWLGCDGCEPTHWQPPPVPPATPEASE